MLLDYIDKNSLKLCPKDAEFISDLVASAYRSCEIL